MRKELLVILGAGTSVDQGMPSVGGLPGHMKTWSAEWFRSDPVMPKDLDRTAALVNTERSYAEEPFSVFKPKPIPR